MNPIVGNIYDFARRPQPEDLRHIQDGRGHRTHPKVKGISARVPKEKSRCEKLWLINNRDLGEHYYLINFVIHPLLLKGGLKLVDPLCPCLMLYQRKPTEVVRPFGR
ncbi:hypothetical protein ACFX13_040909 [Malus domestica]